MRVLTGGVTLLLALVTCAVPARAAGGRNHLLGAWEDHAHGEAEWFFEFRRDGTFVADHLQGRQHMEGTYTLGEKLIHFRWRTLDGAREQAWGRLLTVDGQTLRFRFGPVKHRLAQAPLVELVRPGQAAEQYSEKQLAEQQEDTQPLVRVLTTSGRRYVGAIVESHTAYIVLQTKRGKHKIRRRHIERMEPAMATHAQ